MTKKIILISLIIFFIVIYAKPTTNETISMAGQAK